MNNIKRLHIDELQQRVLRFPVQTLFWSFSVKINELPKVNASKHHTEIIQVNFRPLTNPKTRQKTSLCVCVLCMPGVFRSCRVVSLWLYLESGPVGSSFSMPSDQSLVASPLPSPLPQPNSSLQPLLPPPPL